MNPNQVGWVGGVVVLVVWLFGLSNTGKIVSIHTKLPTFSERVVNVSLSCQLKNENRHQFLNLPTFSSTRSFKGVSTQTLDL